VGWDGRSGGSAVVKCAMKDSSVTARIRSVTFNCLELEQRCSVARGGCSHLACFAVDSLNEEELHSVLTAN